MCLCMVWQLPRLHCWLVCANMPRKTICMILCCIICIWKAKRHGFRTNTRASFAQTRCSQVPISESMSTMVSSWLVVFIFWYCWLKPLHSNSRIFVLIAVDDTICRFGWLQLCVSFGDSTVVQEKLYQSRCGIDPGVHTWSQRILLIGHKCWLCKGCHYQRRLHHWSAKSFFGWRGKVMTIALWFRSCKSQYASYFWRWHHSFVAHRRDGIQWFSSARAETIGIGRRREAYWWTDRRKSRWRWCHTADGWVMDYSLTVEYKCKVLSGIGAIPDAALAALTQHKDLGVHTEMFSDGILDLVECSAVTNSRKKIHPGKIVSGFVYGSKRLYEFMHDNPMIRQSSCLMPLGMFWCNAIIFSDGRHFLGQRYFCNQAESSSNCHQLSSGDRSNWAGGCRFSWLKVFIRWMGTVFDILTRFTTFVCLQVLVVK